EIVELEYECKRRAWKDTIEYGNLLRKLSLLYEEMEEYEKALTLLRQCFPIYELSIVTCVLRLDMVRIYINTKDWIKALDEINTMRSIYLRIKDEEERKEYGWYLARALWLYHICKSSCEFLESHDMDKLVIGWLKVIRDTRKECLLPICKSIQKLLTKDKNWKGL